MKQDILDIAKIFCVCIMVSIPFTMVLSMFINPIVIVALVLVATLFTLNWSNRNKE